MSLSIPDIVALFESRGHEQYAGEPVTQLEHALQSAHLAEQEGADSALISAALLHDVGHLLHDFGETPSLQGLDDVHQYRCLPFLRALFGPATLEPIKLHVDAKRYLCARDATYHDALSEDSRRSLRLQGGVFDAEQARQYEALPFAQDAVRLRRWDDLAKSADMATPPLVYFVRQLEIAARDHGIVRAVER
ncbi:MAG: HD domain-containing protein [Proteobacteria bacterium]|nr:HD domain-containing protein [Pseudomonadota bacterium]